MNKLEYFKGDNLTYLTDKIREYLDEDGSVYIVMEPGDGTHYELICTIIPDGRIAWSQVRDSGGWCAVVHSGFVHLNYFCEKAGTDYNPHVPLWTVMMVCELHNCVFLGGASGHYYDFEKGERIAQ